VKDQRKVITPVKIIHQVVGSKVSGFQEASQGKDLGGGKNSPKKKRSDDQKIKMNQQLAFFVPGSRTWKFKRYRGVASGKPRALDMVNKWGESESLVQDD